VKTLGFTGTRRGMTPLQKEEFKGFLYDYKPAEFHHGDCVGADAEAHELVRRMFPKCHIIIHPCDIEAQRAHCSGDLILPVRPPLARNRNIVNTCAQMFAAPGTKHETTRSGTWATVRYSTFYKVPLILALP